MRFNFVTGLATGLAALGSLLLALGGCGGTSLEPGLPSNDGYFGILSGESTTSLFIEPSAGRTPLLDAIAGAKTSIKVEVYLLSDADILAALVAAAKRGVMVQVMLEPNPFNPADPNSPLTINRNAVHQLQGSGAAVAWSDPAFKYTHAKTMIIDGAAGYICTLNFSKAGFTSNREFAVVDTDPTDLKDLNGIFDADWGHRSYKPTAPSLVVSPDNSKDKLQALIGSAQKTLIIDDEELQDPDAIALLGQRVKAGVSVRVLLASPSDVSDNTTAAAQLQAQGVLVKYVENPVVHAKMIVADGDRGYIGSVNLSSNSMANNREIGILLGSALELKALQNTFEGDWANGQNFSDSQGPTPAGK